MAERPGRRPSVRRSALLWMTLILTAISLAAATIAYAVDIADADRLFDDELRLLAFYAGPGLPARAPPSLHSGEPQDVLIEARDQTGDLIYTSDAGLHVPRLTAPGFGTVMVGGRSWRTFLAASGGGTVQVSQLSDTRRRLARTAALEASLPILASIPLVWLVVGWGLGQMLASLSRLSGTIAARGVESHRPIDMADVPSEFETLVEAMNALIGRWQLSLDQQKQFLSDAAHELRTPLTALSLQIAILTSERAERKDLDAALQELARVSGRASALVDQLLRMARYEAADRTSDRREVEVEALVIACMADFVALAESKTIDLGLVCSEPLWLHCSERDLRLLVSNLIENAVRYTPIGGVVDVGVRAADRKVVIEVADTGSGIPEDLLPRVFDRFFRAPGLTVEGTGLGLAICRAIARRHGLSLGLRNRASGGLIATVTGPETTDPAMEHEGATDEPPRDGPKLRVTRHAGPT